MNESGRVGGICRQVEGWRVVTPHRRVISGGRYFRVPTARTNQDSESSLRLHASPKSMTIERTPEPLVVTSSTFRDLISRWTMLEARSRTRARATPASTCSYAHTHAAHGPNVTARQSCANTFERELGVGNIFGKVRGAPSLPDAPP